MGLIYEDTLNKPGKHSIKNGWWAAHGVEVVRTRLDGNHGTPVSFGDYCADGSNVVVDTKRSVSEVAMNINGRNHARFKRECLRARDSGYRLVVLVENREGYSSIGGLRGWTNDHCRACGVRRKAGCDPADPSGKCPRHGTRKPIQGARLAKAMKTMQERYGVRFEFCAPKDSARIVCELLGVGYERDAARGA